MSEHGGCGCGTVYAHLAETGTSLLVVTAGTRLSTAVRRSPFWSGVDCFHKSRAFVEDKLNAAHVLTTTSNLAELVAFTRAVDWAHANRLACGKPDLHPV